MGGGNGIDWFSSMLRLALDDEDAQWEQVSGMQRCGNDGPVVRPTSGLNCSAS